MNNLIVLGSGTSTGIPMLGCHCTVCTSSNPKNTRLRTSIFLNLGDVRLLVDTTPDLRTQLLSNKIAEIDGVIITHDHADHLHGIDDLRPLTFDPTKGALPIFCEIKTADSIKHRFDYIFNQQLPNLGGGRPQLDLKAKNIPQNDILKWEIMGKSFTFFQLPHGHGHSLGFQVESMAYLIDCHEIPAQVIDFLSAQNLELLIIDCCQKNTHRTHLSQERSFYYIEQIRPKKAGLIHMAHSLEHEQLTKDASDHFSFPVTPVFDQEIHIFPCRFR